MGPEHPDVATCLNNLATLYAAMGKLERTERFYQRALAVYVKSLEPNHPEFATYYNNLGGHYFSKETIGAEHPFMSRCLGEYARLLRATHRDDEAEQLEMYAEKIRSGNA